MKKLNELPIIIEEFILSNYNFSRNFINEEEKFNWINAFYNNIVECDFNYLEAVAILIMTSNSNMLIFDLSKSKDVKCFNFPPEIEEMLFPYIFGA